MTVGAVTARPDYGIDAPGVLRNLFLFGAACLLLGLFGPAHVHLGKVAARTHPVGA